MSVLDNFDRWKEFLGDRVEQAKAAGLSDQQITDVATKMGEYLANKVDPENPQERLLKQLWDANPDQRSTMAKMMINLVTKH
ncbi:DUF3243 domain-containing protein [Effusibacillus lacus]|uniref:DUF3243 domain-containing protein n=1 Tax=Effusibacillus lacus TaxID=1348429 RepID=A0A292YKN2_9BACL|nr:DUF3243 domain-containing protein [Effusibacillus lacus]TCS73650.1 uncharacterized protein DUF3243 [Effusibacillus lacus]GAX89459.1 hypothetical protein [Effusibacillus lacus]